MNVAKRVVIFERVNEFVSNRTLVNKFWMLAVNVNEFVTCLRRITNELTLAVKVNEFVSDRVKETIRVVTLDNVND